MKKGLNKTILLLMILYLAGSHWIEFLNLNLPLYPHFPIFGFITFNLFWGIYLSVAFILSLTLFFSKEEK